MSRRKKSANKSSVFVPALVDPGKRGRKADGFETVRRVAMLEDALVGELNNAKAANELGIKLSAWSVWKSNYLKRTGRLAAVRSIARRRRGRPVNMQHTSVRAAMLDRVELGEFLHQEAARQLDLKPAAWRAWISNYRKRASAKSKRGSRRGFGALLAARGRRAGRKPDKSTVATKSSLAGVVAQLEGLQRFGDELQERIREMIEMAERRFPV